MRSGALHELVRPGGEVLLGEGYWRQPPSAEYLDALGGASADELPDYTGLMRAAEEAGLTPLYASVASEADWDRYEWRLILNAERWAAAHPADPGAEVAARARPPRARADDHAGRARHARIRAGPLAPRLTHRAAQSRIA